VKTFGLTRVPVLILIIGLSTIFLPLFRVSPPVAGKPSWSAWDLAAHVYSRNPPGLGIFFNRSLCGLALLYALMLCGFVAAVLPRPQKALVTISVIGSIAGYEPFYWGHQDFARLLFIATKAGVIEYQPAIYLLIPIMPAVLYMSLSRRWTLDDEHLSNSSGGDVGNAIS
jgi:hypothetical protein